MENLQDQLATFDQWLASTRTPTEQIHRKLSALLAGADQRANANERSHARARDRREDSENGNR